MNAPANTTPRPCSLWVQELVVLYFDFSLVRCDKCENPSDWSQDVVVSMSLSQHR